MWAPTRGKGPPGSSFLKHTGHVRSCRPVLYSLRLSTPGSTSTWRLETFRAALGLPSRDLVIERLHHCIHARGLDFTGDFAEIEALDQSHPVCSLLPGHPARAAFAPRRAGRCLVMTCGIPWSRVVGLAAGQDRWRESRREVRGRWAHGYRHGWRNAEKGREDRTETSWPFQRAPRGARPRVRSISPRAEQRPLEARLLPRLRGVACPPRPRRGRLSADSITRSRTGDS